LSFTVFPVLRVDFLRHEQAFFGFDGFDAIDPRCFLALVFLGYPSHCQQACGFRFHQEFLEFLCCSLIATLIGSLDALLDAETMVLEFLPGHLAPSLTRRAFRLRRCFPLFHLTHFLPSIQQGPRQHIRGVGFLDHRFARDIGWHLLAPSTSLARVLLRFPRSILLFCVTIDACLSTEHLPE